MLLATSELARYDRDIVAAGAHLGMDARHTLAGVGTAAYLALLRACEADGWRRYWPNAGRLHLSLSTRVNGDVAGRTISTCVTFEPVGRLNTVMLKRAASRVDISW